MRATWLGAIGLLLLVSVVPLHADDEASARRAEAAAVHAEEAARRSEAAATRTEDAVNRLERALEAFAARYEARQPKRPSSERQTR